MRHNKAAELCVYGSISALNTNINPNPNPSSNVFEWHERSLKKGVHFVIFPYANDVLLGILLCKCRLLVMIFCMDVVLMI